MLSNVDAASCFQLCEYVDSTATHLQPGFWVVPVPHSLPADHGVNNRLKTKEWVNSEQLYHISEWMLVTWLLLVGGFNPSEKYESQMGLLLFPMYGKITMFQATNQIALVSLEEQVSYENFIHIYASNDCGVECWDVSMVEYTWTWWKKCKIIVETPKVKKQHILWIIYGNKMSTSKW